MRIAFISDIHANIFALKKVIRDIDNQNVDRIICLGDLVGYATYPNEVINLIREKDIMTIQGNYDQSTGEDMRECGCDYETDEAMERASRSLFWTQDEVTEDNKEWLRNLPENKRLEINGWDLLLVHGSPRQNNEYLYPDNEAINDIIDEYQFDILISGHIHLPYFKVNNDRYIVNAGSAGKPKHGNPRATYVILDIEENEIDFYSREVEYDHEKIATEIENESGMPDEFAELFRNGRG